MFGLILHDFFAWLLLRHGDLQSPWRLANSLTKTSKHKPNRHVILAQTQDEHYQYVTSIPDHNGEK
jgi:hypothetical protein